MNGINNMNLFWISTLVLSILARISGDENAASFFEAMYNAASMGHVPEEEWEVMLGWLDSHEQGVVKTMKVNDAAFNKGVQVGGWTFAPSEEAAVLVGTLQHIEASRRRLWHKPEVRPGGAVNTVFAIDDIVNCDSLTHLDRGELYLAALDHSVEQGLSSALLSFSRRFNPASHILAKKLGVGQVPASWRGVVGATKRAQRYATGPKRFPIDLAVEMDEWWSEDRHEEFFLSRCTSKRRRVALRAAFGALREVREQYGLC